MTFYDFLPTFLPYFSALNEILEVYVVVRPLELSP